VKVVLAGCTGFIGTRLVRRLTEKGHECTVLIRQHSSFPPDSCPENVRLAPYSAMPNVADAVINLAGETVVGRWTKKKKARILDTRVDLTRDLVEWMAKLERKPSVFLSGSAVGFYGDRGEELITEATGPDPQQRFRSQVCILWEQEANEASKHEIRVVNLRIGNVLDPSGGMLGQMVPWLKRAPMIMPYGRKNYLPWISLDDTVAGIEFGMIHKDVKGPVNLVAPTPATIGHFFEILGGILKKKVKGQIPKWALKAALGDFSQALLESQRILPEKIVEAGFGFEHTDLEKFLVGLELKR